MRTTLDIDTDILGAARAIATRDGVSIGRALSSLARRGLSDSKRVSLDDGLPVVRVSAAAPPITSQMVRAALDE